MVQNLHLSREIVPYIILALQELLREKNDRSVTHPAEKEKR